MATNISTIKERILQFAEYKNISKRKIYTETGIANGVLDKPGGLSEDSIDKFLRAFPEVSPAWLLAGAGGMTLEQPLDIEKIKTTDNIVIPTENKAFYSNIANNIDTVIYKLIETNKAKSKSDVAKNLRFTGQKLNEIAKDRMKASLYLLNNLSIVYNVSVDYILWGKEPMFTDNTHIPPQETIPSVQEPIAEYNKPTQITEALKAEIELLTDQLNKKDDQIKKQDETISKLLDLMK